jgi:sialic acid synthase SpsE
MSMVAGVRDVEAALGDGAKRVLPAEEELRDYAQRSLQASRAIEVGEPLVEGKNVEILRSGKRRKGAHPRELEAMAGKSASREIPVGDGILPGDWV